MKKTLLTCSIISMATIASAQTDGALFTSWMFNTDGDKAVYDKENGPGTLTVNLDDSTDIKQLYYTPNDVFVTCEGLASYTMGTWPIPNEPSAKDYTFKIPRNPAEETGTKTAVPEGGAIAVAVNGVPFYGYESAESWNGSSNDFNGDDIWNSDAWVNEGTTMDDGGGGHPTDAGNYHYHATPFALYGDIGDGHSPIIGWAPDGYPIYGPYGYDDPDDDGSTVVRMETGYAKRNITVRQTLPDGTSLSPAQYGPNVNATYPVGTYVEDYEYVGGGHLDEYNGRTCITPEFPGGTYAYFITIDASSEPEFPYMLAAEYYGVANTGSIGDETIPPPATKYDFVTATAKIQEATFKMFPNPATDRLILEGMDNPQKISIVNALGEVVLQEVGSLSSAVSIDLSSLEEGFYQVVLDYGETIQTKSLIVDRKSVV